MIYWHEMPGVKKRTKSNPNIFHAASTDDVEEMRQAISLGQRLDEIIPENGHTPLHTAAIWGSENFIKAALAYDHANVWTWDLQDKLPYDHSVGRSDTPIMKVLFEAMYPNGRMPIPTDDNEPR